MLHENYNYKCLKYLNVCFSVDDGDCDSDAIYLCHEREWGKFPYVVSYEIPKKEGSF